MTRLLLPILLLAVLLAACAPAERPRQGDAPDGLLRIVATTSILADLAREVAGDRAEVIGLMGPGVDPHLYRASEGDVARMSRADVILYNGLGLEGRMGEVLRRLGDQAYAVAEAVPVAQRLRSEDFEGQYDPHAWMDAGRWAEAARALAEHLATRDPDHAEGYRARAEAYAERLDGLAAYVRQRVEAIPEGQRVLVTAHDAFGYFGEAYGMEVRGLQGLSTATEAGTADVQDLAAFVAERRIPALFVETSVSPRAIEAVRQAVRARGLDVQIGGDLYSDALGGPGSGAETYEGMLRHNADTIAEALGAPPS
jgi:manganese/zinc/iron transport system substrate-binding protein